MGWEKRRHWPAMAVATVALFAALGGSVYAASRINGHAVKVKSLPGNRLVPRSLPANRLRPGTIPGSRLAPGSITGRQVDAATLGEVPEATRARAADTARRASTALAADSADEAQRLNGRSAGCADGSREFAGACWETEFSATAMTAPEAAAACARRGGELPAPLSLIAFGASGVPIAAEGEWTSAIADISPPKLYGVVTVKPAGKLSSELSGEAHSFRCVIPLLS